MNIREDFHRELSERRRVNILEFLSNQPGYMASTADIQKFLETEKITLVTISRIAADLVMFAEQDLVILIADGAGARITSTGIDVANGRLHMPGIARPLPE